VLRVQRYEIEGTGCCENDAWEVRHVKDGEWVRYEDAAAEIEQLRAAIAAKDEALIKASAYVEDYGTAGIEDIINEALSSTAGQEYHNPADVILPTVKRGKTLYWIWCGKIVRFTYKGIYVGRVIDRRFRIMCEMSLLEDVVINNRSISKGDKRMFYADELDRKNIFTTLKAAKEAFAAIDSLKEVSHDTD
jgi:hypothetical protein